MSAMSLFYEKQGRARGSEPPGPPTRAPSEGGTHGGVLLILHRPQATDILHCIALHSPKLKD